MSILMRGSWWMRHQWWGTRQTARSALRQLRHLMWQTPAAPWGSIWSISNCPANIISYIVLSERDFSRSISNCPVKISLWQICLFILFSQNTACAYTQCPGSILREQYEYLDIRHFFGTLCIRARQIFSKKFTPQDRIYLGEKKGLFSRFFFDDFLG